MPPGDSPDGAAERPSTDSDSRLRAGAACVPVGGSPTGAGESPALPSVSSVFSCESSNGSRQAVSIQSKQPLILIFSPSEGEKRVNLTPRVESLNGESF